MLKKQKVFEKIIKEFVQAKKTILLIEEGYREYLGNESVTDLEEKVRFIVKNVEITLKSLQLEEIEILENEFFKPVKNDWWNKYYSKSTFYRYRSRAIDNFLDLYFNKSLDFSLI